MSNSEMLSKIHMGMNLPTGSKMQDKKLKDIVSTIGGNLIKKYNIDIRHENTLSNKELYEHVPEGNRHVLESPNTGIRPDGGILMILSKSGRRYPLVVSENKKQGDGKNQARGNAIERSGKNIMFMQKWMQSEKILPYVIFARGSDFDKGSYIIDRVATMGYCYKHNIVNIYKDDHNYGGISIFHKSSGHNDKEIYDVVYEIAENALLYYVSKGMVNKNV